MKTPKEAPELYDAYDCREEPTKIRPEADAYWAKVMGEPKKAAPEPEAPKQAAE